MPSYVLQNLTCINLLQFVQDKANFRTGAVGILTSFKYAFGSTLKLDQLRIALATANNVTASYSDVKAYVQCSYYDAIGSRQDVVCTLANYTACALNGKPILSTELDAFVRSCAVFD
jgi:hypothetical protein